MDVDQELREKLAINAVNERLGRSFADSYSRSTVSDTVDQVLHRFDGRPIRDFVPVLVERYAREELRIPRELVISPGDLPTGWITPGAMKKAATELGCTTAQLMPAWQRTKSITSLILDACTNAQLDDSLAALSTEIAAELEQVTRLSE
jgi:hypothetical protein